MQKKNAFTLIELLVVIAILAILMAILVPASMKGVEMARRSSCANNLKSIGIAFLSYAADNQGELPHITPLPAMVPGASFQEVKEFTPIALLVANYVSDFRLWICPSDKADNNELPVHVARKPEDFHSQQGSCSYMYISGYHLMRTPETPALAPLLCDEANEPEWGPADAGNMPDIKDQDNHGKNVRNVLFLDGHVTTFKDADAANMIFENLKNSAIICSVD